MDALRQERKWNSVAAGESLGVSAGVGIAGWIQRVWGGHFKAMGSDLDIMALPIGECGPALQVTDPNSANFGGNLFVLGISRMDGSDVMG